MSELLKRFGRKLERKIVSNAAHIRVCINLIMLRHVTQKVVILKIQILIFRIEREISASNYKSRALVFLRFVLHIASYSSEQCILQTRTYFRYDRWYYNLAL